MKTECNIEKLVDEVNKLDFHLDGSGAEMACRPSNGIPFWIQRFPELTKAIQEIARLRNQVALHMMINKLPSNTIVDRHRDWIAPTAKLGKNPCLERWHLPIQTNEYCQIWTEEYPDTSTHYKLGEWSGPVHYWKLHQVWNTGSTERIHIVIDLDSPTPQGKYDEDYSVEDHQI
jgi:hypothetical protein